MILYVLSIFIQFYGYNSFLYFLKLQKINNDNFIIMDFIQKRENDPE